jgi:hypothetical protein
MDLTLRRPLRRACYSRTSLKNDRLGHRGIIISEMTVRKQRDAPKNGCPKARLHGCPGRAPGLAKRPARERPAPGPIRFAEAAHEALPAASIGSAQSITWAGMALISFGGGLPTNDQMVF